MRQRKNKRTGGQTAGRLAEAVSRLTEFPLEAVSAVPTVTVKGRREVEITGCLGVLEYENGIVVVKTAGGPCAVSGEGLVLSDFHRDVLSVRGRIDAVRLAGSLAGERE